MKMLYFSTVNWRWIKQRPHFISEYLSENKIELEYISLTPFLKQKKHKASHANKFLYINDQYVVPGASKIALVRKINYIFISNLINKKYDIVTITHPEQYYYLIKLLRYKPQIIYECMDNMPYFYQDEKRKKVAELEKNVCRNCDHIITSSNFLKDKIMKKYHISEEKITVIYNAVDKNFFKQKDLEIQIEEPNLMYIGTIANWIDYTILNRFATNHPNYKIYMIGPREGNIEPLADNIKFLGTIPHETVKSYITKGNHLIIPFKTNPLIEAVDPVKMYEYLALGKHVITTKWDELKKFTKEGNISFYCNYDEFEYEVINNEIQSHEVVYNIDFVSQNNWEQRGKQYLDVINKIAFKL